MESLNLDVLANQEVGWPGAFSLEEDLLEDQSNNSRSVWAALVRMLDARLFHFVETKSRKADGRAQS